MRSGHVVVLFTLFGSGVGCSAFAEPLTEGATVEAAAGDQTPPTYFRPSEEPLGTSGTVPPSPQPGGDATSGALTVNARLDGALNGIALSNEATQTNGWYDRYSDGTTSYDHVSSDVHVQTELGAAMIGVSFDNGALNRLLEVGPVTTSGGDYAELGEGAGIYVYSCTGPSIGDYPDEQAPTSLQVTATEDANLPGTVNLVVDGVYPTHGNANMPSRLVATLQLTLPPE